jgi:hypothetical protein
MHFTMLKARHSAACFELFLCTTNNMLSVCCPLTISCLSCIASSLQRWLGLAKQDKGDKPAYVAFKYYVEPKDKKVSVYTTVCLNCDVAALECYRYVVLFIKLPK